MNVLRRRKFLVSMGVSAAAIGVGLPVSRAVGQQAGRKLRTITYNVLKCQGYAPEAPKGAPRRDTAEVARRIAEELRRYEPDIITFQEGPPEGLLGEMARQLGMQHCFFKGGWHGGVLTRFKIVRFENRPGSEGNQELFTRHWGRAILDNGSEEIALYSAHLHPSDESLRAREITEALKVMQEDLRQNRSMIFQGDLNHDPDGPEYPRWEKAGLKDSFALKGNGPAETFDSHKPYKRIDYVWAHGPLAARLGECRVLFEGAFRTKPEDPQAFALSDHLPVLASFGPA